MKQTWNFQRGREFKQKEPSVGELWILSGTIHWDPGGGGLKYKKGRGARHLA